MNALQVEIVTPEESVFSGSVTEVIIPCWEGQLGVLPDHDALLSLLKCGLAEVRTSEGVQRWVIGRGFADIGGDHVTILTDQAMPIDSLDKEGARQMLAEANATITEGSPTSEVVKQAEARVEWAQAVIDA